jgi:hypothetical protein
MNESHPGQQGERGLRSSRGLQDLEYSAGWNEQDVPRMISSPKQIFYRARRGNSPRNRAIKRASVEHREDNCYTAQCDMAALIEQNLNDSAKESRHRARGQADTGKQRHVSLSRNARMSEGDSSHQRRRLSPNNPRASVPSIRMQTVE